MRNLGEVGMGGRTCGSWSLITRQTLLLFQRQSSDNHLSGVMCLLLSSEP